MSYMATAKVSYTIRIPRDLKRLLESAAASGGVTLTSLVVRACWQYLEPSDKGSVPSRLAGARAVGEDQPPDMAALRAIAAGKMTSHEACDPEAEMCSYKEYDQDTGETMHCGLPKHSAKQKHGAWYAQ